MFLTFFYLLRARGLKVSLNEWMILMEALDRGLHESSLRKFYHLCHCILIKDESDADKFDLVFLEYFESVSNDREIPGELLKWLNENETEPGPDDKAMMKELLEQLSDFSEKQKLGTDIKEKPPTEKHGPTPKGVRTGSSGRHKSAVKVARERKFKDFREDKVLDIRQFQVAFRKLRQYSSRTDTAKTELDIDQSIEKTCEQGGMLSLVFDKPRKNSVKILLLIDSDGSMAIYSKLCNRLFQALSKANHFKDLKIYYFHNCIYDNLYTTPLCRQGDWVDTRWVLNNLDGDYRVIFLGDASMAPWELFKKGGSAAVGLYNQEPGLTWLQRFDQKYKKKIWLNPMPQKQWQYANGYETLQAIGEVFPMYELTLNGLESGIKKLLVR